MAFTASKKRGKKIEPMAKGKILMPSAAVVDWYSGAMKLLVREMMDDYRAEIGRLMEADGTVEHFASDAKLPVQRFKGLFARLINKWRSKIDRFADNTAKNFAMKVDKHSFSSVGASLKALGIKEPADIAKTDWETQMATYIAENIALIKSIPEELHSKIERATWNSLTSPEGRSQGAYGVNNAIRECMGKSFDRADFIAQDQTAKLNSVLNVARMEQNQVKIFEWSHSSAGKKPRQCHMKWDGRKFLTKGGPTELYELLPDGTVKKYEAGQDGAKQTDIGKPGHPPRCRCRARPVLELL